VGPLSVSFSLATAAPARLEILDVAGRRVHARTLDRPVPGTQQLSLSGVRLAPGVYVIRLEAVGLADRDAEWSCCAEPRRSLEGPGRRAAGALDLPASVRVLALTSRLKEVQVKHDLRAINLAFVVIVAALSATRSPAFAADIDGFPLCTAPGDQLSPIVVADGAGGFIAAWHDQRPTVALGGVCFAQRVNATGTPQWALNGVALSTTGDLSDPTAPAIAADGAGGAFVAYGGSSVQPRAQWVNAAGSPQWGADGVTLTNAVPGCDLSRSYLTSMVGAAPSSSGIRSMAQAGPPTSMPRGSTRRGRSSGGLEELP
jgi:hypothetical protein